MNDILNFIADNHLRILDILGTVVGVVYIILEYRASIWLWAASIIMPLIDIALYLDAGLYADFGMAVYRAMSMSGMMMLAAHSQMLARYSKMM